MSDYDGVRAMPWRYDDGGRAKAGRKGDADDCVVRALAIAMRRDYATVYDELAAGNATQRRGKRSRAAHGKRTASHGICTRRKWFRDYMAKHGWQFFATMGIGTGCTVHLAVGEVPDLCIAAVSKHYVAVVDGEVRDTHDPTRGGTRCVYGYWHKPVPPDS